MSYNYTQQTGVWRICINIPRAIDRAALIIVPKQYLYKHSVHTYYVHYKYNVL